MIAIGDLIRGAAKSFEATMTTRGRVTIPKRLRDAVGWKRNDKLQWSVDGEVAIISKVDSESELADGSILSRQTSSAVPNRITNEGRPNEVIVRPEESS
jgi:AbrB family looped-hinge helix DNA binding protein